MRFSAIGRQGLLAHLLPSLSIPVETVVHVEGVGNVMVVTVEVPPRYVRIAHKLAAERNESFEQNDSWDNQSNTWGVDPEQRNVVGLMGEFAFAEYAGLEIDTSRQQWSDGGSDFDATIRNKPTAIDVKTAQKEPKALMIKEYSVNADYYVLDHLDGHKVTFYGGAWSDQVKNGIRKESQFGHTNYTLGIDYLEPLPDPEEIAEGR